MRVFLTYGSFFMDEHALTPDGLAKFDQLLQIAEAAGIYVHPTGPDHWEGLPTWAKQTGLPTSACWRRWRISGGCSPRGIAGGTCCWPTTC